MRLPIRARMTAWYVALLALVVAAVGAFLVAAAARRPDRGRRSRLRPAAAQIADGYRAEGAPEADRRRAQRAHAASAPAAQILDPRGRVVVSASAIRWRGRRCWRAPTRPRCCAVAS